MRECVDAGVAELADAPDSKSDGDFPREGSTPSSGTLIPFINNYFFFMFYWYLAFGGLLFAPSDAARWR